MILPGQLIHAWKMINFLVGLHLCNAFWKNCNVGPKDIPVFAATWMFWIARFHLIHFLLLKRQFEIKQTFCNPTNYEILCVGHVYQKPFFIFKLWVVCIIFHPNSFCKPPVFSISTFLLLFLLFLCCSNCSCFLILEFFIC